MILICIYSHVYIYIILGASFEEMMDESAYSKDISCCCAVDQEEACS